MKRDRLDCLTLALLFALLGLPESFAQTRYYVQLGIVGATFVGETNSSSSGGMSTDFSMVTRFSAGLGASVPLRAGLYIHPEVVYVVKGASVVGDVEFPDSPGRVPVKAVSIPYFEIPILLGYDFGGKSIRPRIFAGPYLAYKINAKTSYGDPDGELNFVQRDDSVERWDHGVVVGAALHFSVADEELAVGVRGSFGLAKVTRQTDSDIAFNQSLHNRSVGLFAAIVF